MKGAGAMIDEWYPVSLVSGLTEAGSKTALMGEPIEVVRTPDGAARVTSDNGRALPVRLRYGHVWSSLGTPAKEIFAIPEADQPGRRFVDVGVVRVRCSPLRAVENFLDIAHFPFVHTDILGAEPHTEVENYKVEIREKEDEVWATQVKFYQPQAAKSATSGITTEYMYRVPAPTCSVLYKTCPPRPGEWDVITLFVQPLAEDLCDVWPWMALFDDVTPMTDLIHFQQMIFLQDRSILENQIPALLPLDPGMEIPTRADLTSIAYRRWLKRRNYLYGAQLVAQ
ncbi:phenylpropionate dioxygenase-like ring-hydroxylating dioxygenase large terminal subunit [Rhizobium sp. BK049]|uniref:aromatic ring-hydroxylating oxygenase subunit alpha n=1 Tax=Rhizobium TaxID=379 RepID=UPI00160C532D|nr:MULTISPECIES: aromatic ring-hydroxylating dioxygenase subunit alpha [Rhizobium]MBB3351466.1 phenylpropionate dioxygenase-like ring-hydroxylating dioxygenase large terminal subunit [Rhizobium sp. BK049]MBX5151638.1 aromatic ring-hydroxylating dioxygenase subunit alpha [Rhizobium lentis]MBX5176830.1 aromatic ring-hydroxylating dioxygenase subunit alpha [Rhizobium lentis]